MDERAWHRLRSGAAVSALVALVLFSAGCSREREEEEEHEAAASGVAAGREARQSAPQTFAAVDWTQVDRALGKAGARQPDGAYKVGLPRSDLHVSVAGIPVKPALALGSWVAFEQVSDSEALLMGDLVLLEGEIGPVLGKLEEGGIQVTALHNHLLQETPRVMYMHVGGRGAPAGLARTLHAALVLTKTPLGPPPGAAVPTSPPPSPQPLALDTLQIAQILGYHGKVNGGVYQVGVPRAEPITMDGTSVPASMGVTTSINFQPTGKGEAAITGDFVLVASEVNPVLRALHEHAITVTALHSHMLGDSPHLYFMHYWAHADGRALARGLRAALDQMNVRKP